MAHFAKLGINSKVISVEVVADADCENADNNEDESVGIQFLEHIHGWPLWKQTSYNTHANVHSLGGTPFRKNYAGVGHTYDEDRDAFIPPNHMHHGFLMKLHVFGEHQLLIQLYKNTAILLKTMIFRGMKLTLVG